MRDFPRRQEFLGVEFDGVTLDDLLDRLSRVTSDSAYSYIVTPNVDHIVRLTAIRNDGRDAEVRTAYDRASLCVCDSRVLAGLARSCGIDLPVCPGSDLTARLFDETVVPGDRVAIVGGCEEVLRDLRKLYQGVDIRHHMPPMGLRHDEAALDRAVGFVVESRARFTFLAVGSPQQEILAHRIASRPEARGCALCVGAAIEFVSAHRKRAPRMLQKLGLEWSYRLVQDPARMWRRYLWDGPRIFPIVLRWKRVRSSRG